MFKGQEATSFPPVGDFLALRPLTVLNERRGDAAWQSSWGEPELIRTKKKYPQAVLDQSVQKLIDGAWQVANPTDGAVRGTLQAGSHRGPVNQQFNVYHDQHAIRGLAGKRNAAHLSTAVATDWSLMKEIPLVSAYTFRGETRHAADVQRAGGFFPPNTRTDDAYITDTVHPSFDAYIQTKFGIGVSVADFRRLFHQTFPKEEDRNLFYHYSRWRAMHEREAMHLGRMVATEDMKGYISTTKAVTIAKAFAKSTGFVYVTLVRSGFLMPPKMSHVWTQEYGEEEVAVPVPVPWSDVMGYRQMGVGLKFDATRPLYLRRTFRDGDNDAFKRCYRLLSGYRQPDNMLD